MSENDAWLLFWAALSVGAPVLGYWIADGIDAMQRRKRSIEREWNLAISRHRDIMHQDGLYVVNIAQPYRWLNEYDK